MHMQKWFINQNGIKGLWTSRYKMVAAQIQENLQY